jgi:peptidoglycan/LPS O-acetylase OafA/YrhL
MDPQATGREGQLLNMRLRNIHTYVRIGTNAACRPAYQPARLLPNFDRTRDNSDMVIKNIQALRAIAANGVLVSHLFIVEQKYNHGGAVLSANAHLGAFGVDLFFVISGFIMATIARNASWQKFLCDRAMRILPPYWFYTTLVLIVSFYVPAYVNSSFERPPSIWHSYLLIPDSVGPLLAVGWTLMHEMYFYLCFALIISLTGGFRFRITSLLPIWSVAVICLNAVVQLTEISDPVVAVITHPLTLEFIFGAAAGILIQRNCTAFSASTLIGGIIIFTLALSLSDDALGLIDGQNWKRVILVGAPCALIVYGLVGIEVKNELTAPHWLVALGNASYSTYLSHVLVLSAIGRMFAAMPNHNFYSEAAFVIVSIIIANVIGLVSYSLIERRPSKRAVAARTQWRLAFLRAKSPPPR